MEKVTGTKYAIMIAKSANGKTKRTGIGLNGDYSRIKMKFWKNKTKMYVSSWHQMANLNTEREIQQLNCTKNDGVYQGDRNKSKI